MGRVLAGGGTASMEQFRGHPLLLVFLRHLG